MAVTLVVPKKLRVSDIHHSKLQFSRFFYYIGNVIFEGLILRSVWAICALLVVTVSYIQFASP